MSKKLFLILPILVFLTLGCSSTKPANISNHIMFNQGLSDGCTTAKGHYKKESHLFRSDPNYNAGWFHGRKNCN
jgi:uncharacterized protein YcfL